MLLLSTQLEKRKAQTAVAMRAQPRLLLETGAARRGAAAFPSADAALIDGRALEPAPLAVALAFAPLEKRGAQQRFVLARGK